MKEKNVKKLSAKEEASCQAILDGIIRHAPPDSLAVSFLNALEKEKGILGVAAFLYSNLKKDGIVRFPLLMTKQEFGLLDHITGGTIGKMHRREFWSRILLYAGTGSFFENALVVGPANKKSIAQKYPIAYQNSQDELTELNKLHERPENYGTAVKGIVRRRQAAIKIIDNEIVVEDITTIGRGILSVLVSGIGVFGLATSGDANSSQEELTEKLSKQFVAAFEKVSKDPKFSSSEPGKAI